MAGARPGSGLLDPIAIAAIALLALNDQWLKAAWPGPVTWIASDVAGLIVAPLALQAVWEIGVWAVGRWQGPSLRVLAVAIAVVGIGFVAVQVWPPATDAYRSGLGAAQWPFRAVVALIGGAPIPASHPCRPSAMPATSSPSRPSPSRGGGDVGGSIWRRLREWRGRSIRRASAEPPAG